MNKNKNSLAEKIAAVLTAAPASVGSDDEYEDNTKANVDIEDFENDEDLDVSSFKSQIRKQNVELLADVDEKYAGRQVKRKRESSDEEYDDNSEDDDGVSFNNNNDKYDEESEEEDEDNEGESNDSESDNMDQSSDSDKGSSTEQDQIKFKTFSKTDDSSQVNKGMCVKNQLSIWENLLEMRISTQKCLTAANKMPQLDNYKEIKSEPEFLKSVQSTKKSLTNLLEKFLLLQTLLQKKSPNLKKFNSSKSVTNDPDDEEIPSDTDEEIQEKDEDSEVEEQSKKKFKICDIEKEIEQQHDNYKNYQNMVIQKWQDKTKIHFVKNATNTYSVVNNIKHTLDDKARLIKRTQLKRSDYTILGEYETKNNHKKETDDNKQSGEYNSEIFDDTDFYHELLRELIEMKSADLTDPVQLSRQWIKLQNLRTKMKRKIDTRATKGRKIRYAVHNKLVNFMAPIENHMWTEEAKTELFGSLFGKNQISAQ